MKKFFISFLLGGFAMPVFATNGMPQRIQDEYMNCVMEKSFLVSAITDKKHNVPISKTLQAIPDDMENLEPIIRDGFNLTEQQIEAKYGLPCSFPLPKKTSADDIRLYVARKLAVETIVENILKDKDESLQCGVVPTISSMIAIHSRSGLSEEELIQEFRKTQSDRYTTTIRDAYRMSLVSFIDGEVHNCGPKMPVAPPDPYAQCAIEGNKAAGIMQMFQSQVPLQEALRIVRSTDGEKYVPMVLEAYGGISFGNNPFLKEAADQLVFQFSNRHELKCIRNIGK